MKDKKVIITGTGRAGTTFLVKLFTELGLDTGYTKETLENKIFKECNAGLENFYNKSLKNVEPTPYILKSPRFSEKIDELKKHYDIDLVIIPKRNIRKVIKSRLYYGKNKPGGSFNFSRRKDLKKYLRRNQRMLTSALKKHSIPYQTLRFPKITKDPKYLYKKLDPLLHEINYTAFEKAFYKIKETSRSDYYKTKKFNWLTYLESRPDLKINWNGPVRAWVHWIIFSYLEKWVYYIKNKSSINLEEYILNKIRYRGKAELKGSNTKVINLVKKYNSRKYCEIGCNWGNTAVEVAKVMEKGSEMHLFDIDHNIQKTKEKLHLFKNIHNIFFYKNSSKDRDNYCWNLAEIIKEDKKTFDFVFIDGSHDFTIDGLAFFLCDLLLENNGIVYFDDIKWSFKKSKTINPTVHPKTKTWYTEHQMSISQNSYFCDTALSKINNYRKLEEGLYQKIS